MKDKEILEEVYRQLIEQKECSPTNDQYDAILQIQCFIEQEWQREDEQAKIAANNFEFPVPHLFSDSWYKKDKNLEKASVSDKNKKKDCGKTIKINPKTCQQKPTKD